MSVDASQEIAVSYGNGWISWMLGLGRQSRGAVLTGRWDVRMQQIPSLTARVHLLSVWWQCCGGPPTLPCVSGSSRDPGRVWQGKQNLSVLGQDITKVIQTLVNFCLAERNALLKGFTKAEYSPLTKPCKQPMTHQLPCSLPYFFRLGRFPPTPISPTYEWNGNERGNNIHPSLFGSRW